MGVNGFVLVARLWACIQTRSITESHCEPQGRAQLVCELSVVLFVFFKEKSVWEFSLGTIAPGLSQSLRAGHCGSAFLSFFDLACVFWKQKKWFLILRSICIALEHIPSQNQIIIREMVPSTRGHSLSARRHLCSL